jgi:hypothetical protein
MLVIIPRIVPKTNPLVLCPWPSVYLLRHVPGGASKPGSVLDGHLSRSVRPATSSPGSCSHLQPSRRATCRPIGLQPKGCGCVGDCRREDCPFHSVSPRG